MVRLSFFGGVGQIGGNKILLEDRDTKVFLDFGVNYGDRARFYSEPWLSPRDERGLFEFGLLPRLSGAYKFDAHPAEFDAVFVSHAHTDHWMYVSFLKREIPVHCGETTGLILKTFSEISRSFETGIEGLRIQAFQTGDKVKVGSIEVEPVHVDHSVPGAHAFVIHTTEGAVVYTGDFRMHGTRAEMTDEFIQRAAEARPAVMLCEGTNVVGADSSTEEEVRAKMSKVTRNTPSLVLANFRYSDLDRTRSLLECARENDRKLAISLKHAYFLHRLRLKNLRLPQIDSSDFLVFRRSKKWYFKWEQEILSFPNVVGAQEMQEMQNKVILASSFSDLAELLEIRPRPGSTFINSSSEPFNEDQDLEYDKFVNWLDHLGLPMFRIHCSGHIMPDEVRKVIQAIRPRKLLPIHTEYPSLFAKFVSNLTKVELPQMASGHEL